MPITKINFTLSSTNRIDIRKDLIMDFLQEQAGTGSGVNTSIYHYNVETLQNGARVYLKRPARLNKGFDFEVNIENMYFGSRRRTTMPSHKDIYNDLSAKKAENPQMFVQVKSIVDDLYNCRNVSDETMIALSLSFQSGYSLEAILKAIKWLFIEQDITYWNWSGRNMLYTHLSTI